MWLVALIHCSLTCPQLFIRKGEVSGPLIQLLSIEAAFLAGLAEHGGPQTEPRLLPPPPHTLPLRTLPRCLGGHKLLDVHVLFEALRRDVAREHTRSVGEEVEGVTVVSDGLMDAALVGLTLAVGLYTQGWKI